MQVIPKRIHYIWFGNNPKSELILKCIDSWKRFFPDYEIIEWNESNYDVTKNTYMKEAYDAQKWAFASDYARFDIIYNYGGIYLDTDVEFLKPIPEEILAHTAFTGYESTGHVSPGLIYAAVPGFSITKELLEEYNGMYFEKDSPKTVNLVITQVLEKHQALSRNVHQLVNGLMLYPSQYFCGYDLDVHEYDIQPETISVHHYSGSWTENSYKRKLQGMIKKKLGLNAYRKILRIKRCIFGISK